MQPGGFEQIVAREQGLHRRLGSARLSMIALGGAIGTGLFLGSAFAIGLAGPGVLVSYAIGALVALLLAGCLAEMTLAHPVTGSFGAFAEYYLGPLAGFLVRYTYWTCIVLAVGTEVSAVAVYMRFWFPAVPGWCWVLGFSATLIAINACSVGAFGLVEYWFSAIKVTAILAFIALATWILLRGGGPASGMGLRNYSGYGGFLPHGAWGVWVAVIVALFSYLSIEMIAVAAGEAEDPGRTVRRAFRVTAVRLVLFYLATLALILALVPWPSVGTQESPFVRVMRLLGIPAAAGVCNLVILIAALSAMNSQLYITSRTLFSLARAGEAPPRFGVVSARGIPLQALMMSSIGVAAAAVANVLAPAGAYLAMVSVSAFGALFTWMMIFLTHYRFRRAQGPAAPGAFRMAGFPLTTLTGAALMAAVLVTSAFTAQFRLTLVFGLPFLGLLVCIYRLRHRSGRASSSSPAR